MVLPVGEVADVARAPDVRPPSFPGVEDGVVQADGDPLLLAGLPTDRLGSVALTFFGPPIRGEERVAAAAFAPGSRAAHRARHFGGPPPGRTSTSSGGQRVVEEITIVVRLFVRP